MKTIGLIGGMSWESTELYYRHINQETKRIRGGLHSAPIALVSLDFQKIEALQRSGDWETAGAILIRAARQLEAARADFLLICANTMHKVAGEVTRSVGLPLLHVADATASRVKKAGIQTIGLLGTRFTMEEDFYRSHLINNHGLKVLTPNEGDRDLVHRVIYEELCLGKIRDESRVEFLRIVEDLRQAGAQGVIEGCTEIVMLLQQSHTDLPLFDTTTIHAEEAVALALATES